MSLAIPLTRAVMPVAHPETSHPHVDVPTLVVLLVTVSLVVVVAVAVPRRRPGAEAGAPPAEDTVSSWAGSLSVAQRATRALSVLLLVTALVAGRIGVDDELENLAPALTVGAGWPLLLLGCLVVGVLWRWVDPWDAVARVLAPDDRSRPPGHVWPAVALALPWLWFLGVYPRPFDPRAVGVALAAYTVVTVAGCLALGRARWLASAEPVGLLLSWAGLVPRRLIAWDPPRGAGALLGGVVGGLLMGAVRRTELWSGVAVRPDALLWSTAALVLGFLLGAGSAHLAARAGPVERRAAVVQALVPVAVAVALAVALARNRFFTSVQLLPGLLGDPLGAGWDLLGSPTERLEEAPLGATGLVALQLAVVVAGHLLAAATAPRSMIGDERLPTIVVLAVSAAVSIAVLSLH